MEESQRVADSIYFGLGAVCIIALWWWLTDTTPDATESRWTQIRLLFMSCFLVRADDQADDQADENSTLSDVSGNEETPESSTTMPKDEGNEIFQFSDAFMALARLIQDGKLTESDALRVGIKAPSGGSKRYKAARRLLTEALNQLAPDQYAPLTQAQIDNRRDLDLPIKN